MTRLRSTALRAIPALLLFACLLPLSGCKGKLRNLIARVHHRKATSPANSNGYASEIQTLLSSPQLPILRWPNDTDYQPAAQQFYNDRDNELAWTRDLRPTATTNTLIQLFGDAQKKGLNPEDYDASRWPGRLQRLETIRQSKDDSDRARGDVAQFDVAMTIASMRYLSDLHLGRINPQSLNFDIDVPSKRAAFDVATLLNDRIVDSEDAPNSAASVEPRNPMYKATEEALARYLDLAAQQSANPQPPLPPVTASIAPGGSYPAIEQLTQRLQLEQNTDTGDDSSSSDAPDAKGSSNSHDAAGAAEASRSPRNTASKRYTNQIAAAVMQYQMRHGLAPDGKLSQSTIDSLNAPLTLRVQQLDDALERWRWLPDNYIQPRVMVNLPEFVVRTYGEDHALVFKMKTVEGEADGTHDTPMFVRLMRYVVFRPYWNLPADIVKKDLVPHMEKEGVGYLARNGYEVTNRAGKPVSGWTVADLAHARYMVRQKPGPKNSLGLVKFLFPNVYDVYMHSTPEMNLFNLRKRDRSHGCVRLQDAAQMALWVLSGDQPDPQTQTRWDADKIDDAMNGDDNNKTYNLTTPLPVVLAYFTANADEDGTIHFFNDVYGYDAQLEQALAKGRPYEQAPVKINPKLTIGETE